jgi:hypothetical protein
VQTRIASLSCTPLGGIAGQVDVQFRDDAEGATVAVDDDEVVLGPEGSFFFALEDGSYDIESSLPSYLSATMQGVQMAAGETVDLGTVTLRAGDVNGDGFLDILDPVAVAVNLGLISVPGTKQRRTAGVFVILR